MDNFLLAENPMRPDDHGIYIVHLLYPIAIIKCMEGTVLLKQDTKDIFKRYQFRNSVGVIEKWTFIIYHLFTADFLEESDQRLIPMLDRAWQWYLSYLEWRNNNK